MENLFNDLIAENPVQSNSWSPDKSGKCHIMCINRGFEVMFFASYDATKTESSDRDIPSFYTTKTAIDVDAVYDSESGDKLDITKIDLSKLEDYIYKNLFL